MIKRFPFIIMLILTVLVLNPLSASAQDWPNQGNFVGGDDRERHALVVDIDGSLTIYMLADFGPTNGIFLDTGKAFARDGAALLLNVYYRLGYDIVYLAARPKNMTVNGISMGDATLQWLHDNGFPTEPDRTVLLLRDAPDKVLDAHDRGAAMAEYMGADGTKFVAEMLTELKQKTKISYEHGYCDSDVVMNAYLNVGIAGERIVTIGNKGVGRLGAHGTHAITGPGLNPGYGAHIVGYVIPTVKPAGM